MRRGLPLELFLGLRYLTARGSRANLSLFVWIGVGGVFLGVAALIVVLAVMTGFQDGIRDRIISANPHLLVFQSGAAGLADPAGVVARVTTVPGVRAATPFVLQQALFTSAGGDAHGGLVRGVDFESPAVRDDLRAQLRGGRLEGAANDGAILLGVELARTLGVVPGDAVTVISPKGAMTAVGMVPKMRRYTVAGTIEVGMYEYDASLAYLSLPEARDFAGLAGVTGVEVRLDDPFTIIVLVAAFAIIGHLVLLVAEKRKEIGVLKAIGASASSITAVFFAVGMTIGVVGTLAGSAVGLAIIWIQNTYKIIKLAGDVYQIDYLPMKLASGDFLLIVSATLLLSFLATIVPARRAGALAPVDVLRYE